MAIRPILQLGDPLLREKCEEVTRFNSPELIALKEDLSDTVRDSFKITGYGRAIAAPQIGYLKRVIFLSVPQPLLMINPEIIEHSKEKEVVWDACLSFLSIFMQVERHLEVTIRYQDFTGALHTLKAGKDNDLAELLQHEIDHLDGILAIDRVVDLKTICTKQEFEKRFKQFSPYS